MEFKFSAEENNFRKELRQFLDQELTPEFRASLEGREWSREFSMKMGERGYLSLVFDDSHDHRTKLL